MLQKNILLCILIVVLITGCSETSSQSTPIKQTKFVKSWHKQTDQPKSPFQKELITGAFGFKLGEVCDGCEVEKMNKFTIQTKSITPPQPNELFENYFLTLNAKTRKIQSINAMTLNRANCFGIGEQIARAVRKKYEWKMSRGPSSDYPQLVYWGEDPKGTIVFIGCLKTNDSYNSLSIQYSMPEKIEVESDNL